MITTKHTMKEAHFPGDPRFSGWISPSSDDTSALSTNDWLSTLLLDCILQRSVPPQEVISMNTSHIGSLGIHAYMNACNDLIRNDPAQQVVEDALTKGRKIARIRNIARIWKQMKDCFHAANTIISRLLIPIVLGSHFFVLCLDCCFSTPEFVANVILYDSLKRRTRHVNHNVITIVKDVNFFLQSFILHEKKHEHLRETDKALIGRLHYGDCPIQDNGFDCGLFAVGIVLHLIEGKDIYSETFTQKHITNLRSRLATVFEGDGAESGTTSQVVRGCFPQLRGSSILGMYGLEVVSREPKKERQHSSGSSDLSSAAVILMTSLAEVRMMEEKMQAENCDSNNEEEDAESDDDDDDDLPHDSNKEEVDAESDDDDDDDEYFDCDNKDEDSVGTSALMAEEGEGKQESSVPEKSLDHILYDILDEAKIDCFYTLEEVMPFIEKYEVRSGNCLRVQRSISNRFKQFQCVEHVNCTFRVLISKRRSDGMFCVRKISGVHSEVRRPKKAADGRKWKKRRNGMLDDVIDQIVRTKKGTPTPADVVKTAATKSGLLVSYMTAYRALGYETSSMRNAVMKNFEMVVPFLEGLKRSNPGSVIGYSRDEEMRLVDVHVFPGIMNGRSSLFGQWCRWMLHI